MANQTVYPYGTGGSLPSSIGIINDRTTGGADKAWSAEQGKLACQQIDKNTEDIFEMFATAIDKTSYTLNEGWTITNLNIWQKVTGADKVNWNSVLIPITPGKRYRVYAHSTNQHIAILASDSMVENSSPDFCTGYDGRIVVSPGNVYDFIAPEDAAYLYFLMTSSGNAEDGTLAYSDEDVPNVAGEFKVLQDDVVIINSQRIPKEGLPVYEDWTIGSNGKWVDSHSLQPGQFASMMYPITPGETYRVIADSMRGGLFAILASDTKSNGSMADFCTDYPSRMTVQPGKYYEFTAPADSAFLYITVRSSGNEYDCYPAVPKSIDKQFQELETTGAAGASGLELDAMANIADGLGNKLYPIHPELDENGFVVPETIQELNVQKKAQQFCNIVWTPLADVPYNYSTDYTRKFPAGTPVTGLPYSSVKELDKYIGKDVSIHTFMTAVNNPYSLLYTENVSASKSQSAWGKTYHGENCATYFGTVCSQFVPSCNGGVIDYATAFHPWLAKSYHAEVKVFDQSAQGVRVGDLYWYIDHCRLIYAVKKNSSGVVTHIQIAESNYNHCVINSVMTATEFENDMATKDCLIFRPLWLYKNIDYVPSPYVAVGDETPETVVYNDDICTFAGDKATFREGDTIAINYNLKQIGTWTSMQLYKGSTLVDTFTIDPSVHTKDLTAFNLTYGKYKARMTDGVNYSDYTEFEILQTDVTASNSGEITTVGVTSANGKPVAIKVCGITGGARCMLELTEEQREAASFDMNLVGLALEQAGLNIRGESDLYLKVYFQGEFGRVTNEPLPIYFT
jgi:hypothetical protein